MIYTLAEGSLARGWNFVTMELTPYSAHMSSENTYKLMGCYTEVLILGVTLQYMVSASFLQG